MRRFIAALAAALIVTLLGMAASPRFYLALAHGPAKWIQDGVYKNAIGELCCGEQDCGYKVGGTVHETKDGYAVDAWFLVEPPNAEPFLIHLKELVPHADTTPSPTGEYWFCKWDEKRKCFFAPPPGM